MPQEISQNNSLACSRWYAVNTQPKREPLAEQNLVRQDFETFSPKISKVVRHARRAIATKVALFPGYMFVRLDLSRDRWRSVNGTFGVVGLVMEGDLPKAVPNGIVEGFVAATNAMGLFETREEIAAGNTVRVLSGPFADRLGRVVELKGHERVAILLEMMGAQRPLTLSRKHVLRVA